MSTKQAESTMNFQKSDLVKKYKDLKNKSLDKRNWWCKIRNADDTSKLKINASDYYIKEVNPNHKDCVCN